MTAILIFFCGHWITSVFAQSFFLHRYAAHGMLTMNKFWEKFFHLFTIIAQGPSYLNPYGYAVLHRMHHAWSDTEKDPHSPWHAKNFFAMMWKTKNIYDKYAHDKEKPDEHFTQQYIPRWKALDSLGQSWIFRIGAGSLYALFYWYFVPEGQWAWYLLLPVHWLMGPIHGAIVNWGGHKYGYTNHETGDKAKNTLPFDFLTFGELFQNNHHNLGTAINFGYTRWFEIDPTYQVIRVLKWLRIVRVPAASLNTSAA